MRGQGGGDAESVEGKGEVIEVTATPVPLSALDASPELLQSGFWGSFKQSHGWEPRGFAVGLNGVPREEFPLLVLLRPLLRLFTIAYVPFGPAREPGADRWIFLSALAKALRDNLPRTTMVIRFDLPWTLRGEGPVAALAPRVVKSPHDMQPASTVVVDIAPPLDVVIAAMKSKTRYNIRLAEKKGVKVAQGGAEDVDAWYAIYRETSRRDRIGIHSRGYYSDLLETARTYAGARPDIRLLLATHEGTLLAGTIVAFWKDRAAYLYGASSGEKRNLMPTYALQWEAIRLARDAGCTSYDLFGVPPRPDPGHPMFGLYQFKTGFREEVRERWGTWDVPCRPAAYACYLAAEAARMFYHRSLKKRLRGRPRAGHALDHA